MERLTSFIPTLNKNYGGPVFAFNGMNEILKKKYFLVEFSWDRFSSLNLFKYYKIFKIISKCELSYINMFWGFEVLVPLALSIILKKKIIIVPHGSLNDGRFKDKFKKKLWIILFASFYRSNQVTYQCLNNYEKTQLSENGFNNSFICPNPVRDRYLQLGIEHKKKKIVKFIYLGRISKEKNLNFLIDTLYLYKDTNIKVELDIVGSGKDLDFNKIKEINFYNPFVEIKVHGEKNQKEAFNMVRLSDFSILPSFSEGLSMFLVESLMLRKPIIISTGCNFEVDWEEGKIGKIFQFTKEDALKKIIWASKLTQIEYNELSNNSRKVFLSHFSINKVKKLIYKNIDKCLGS